jgi:hypothetical protein
MMGENDPQIGARRLSIYLRSGIEFLAGAERKRNSLRLENAIENMTGECVFFGLCANRLSICFAYLNACGREHRAIHELSIVDARTGGRLLALSSG